MMMIIIIGKFGYLETPNSPDHTAVTCREHDAIRAALHGAGVDATQTRNRKHRRAAAKPAACAKHLMLSTPGSKGKRVR